MALELLPAFEAFGAYRLAHLLGARRLHGAFVFVQTVRHREHFLPSAQDIVTGGSGPATRPTSGAALISLGLLLACLVAVVGLAKALTPAVDAWVAALGAPEALVGIVRAHRS